MTFSLRGPALVGWGLAAALGLAPALWAQSPLLLREPFSPGYQYHVSNRAELSGALSLPPDKGKTAPKALTVAGTSAIEYDERVLALGANGQVQKTARIYRRLDFQRKVGEQPQENTLRPAVRRLVLLRHQHKEVPFSPDGPLLWSEIDLVRTDVFTPALSALLPDKPVRIGDRWTAATSAVEEITDLERIEDGRVECRLEESTTVGQRRYARVALAGTVRGTNEDGPNRQQLEGYFFFDLDSHHLSYLYLKGTHYLLNKDGQEVGKLSGSFVLTRQAGTRSPDLTDEALKGLVLEPTDDNTLLLYESPELGVRFLYPRRWRVAGARGRQITLDEAQGSGLLITLEPPRRVPGAAQFLAESRDWLQQQKARILRIDQARRLQPAPQELDHFALDIEMASQRVLMDYCVLRQAGGGATLAARLLPADAGKLQQEIERIARSLTLTRAVADEPKK